MEAQPGWVSTEWDIVRRLSFRPLRVTPCRRADLHRTSEAGTTAIIVASRTDIGPPGSGVEANPDVTSVRRARQFLAKSRHQVALLSFFALVANTKGH